MSLLQRHLFSRASSLHYPSDHEVTDKSQHAYARHDQAYREEGRPIVQLDEMAPGGNSGLEHDTHEGLELERSTIDRRLPTGFIGEAEA